MITSVDEQCEECSARLDPFGACVSCNEKMIEEQEAKNVLDVNSPEALLRAILNDVELIKHSVIRLHERFDKVENLTEMVAQQVVPVLEAVEKSPFGKFLGVKL